MEITFLGAAGEVTGSSYLLTDASTQLLIDFGMFQGLDIGNLNYNPLGFDPKSLAAVFVTHAHLDHCGRLPLLKKYGYQGKVYMTAATMELVALSLMDAAKIAKENKTRQALYSVEDVEVFLHSIQTISYREQIRVHDFSITFQDAGHILGSASIVIQHGGQCVVFSGDLGNSPQPLVQPTTLIDKANIVVMESTYGDRQHPQEDIAGIFQKEINTIEQDNGVLLIPAFSLDRTQEILHILHHLKKDKKIKESTPIFLDSPMAIKATAIYQQFPNLWSDELKSHPDDPFDFPNLHMIQDAQESRKIQKVRGPKVIIAGNGMMSGGRIMGHAKNYLSFPTTRLLLVGYQAEGTLGRDIYEGAKVVKIEKEKIQVRAQISTIEDMSAHADQSKLVTWIQHILGVNEVFLTHGDSEQRTVFATLLQQKFPMVTIFTPKLQEKHTI